MYIVVFDREAPGHQPGGAPDRHVRPPAAERGQGAAPKQIPMIRPWPLGAPSF